MSSYRPKSLEELNDRYGQAMSAEQAIKKGVSGFKNPESPEKPDPFAADRAQEDEKADAGLVGDISPEVSDFIKRFAPAARPAASVQPPVREPEPFFKSETFETQNSGYANEYKPQDRPSLQQDEAELRGAESFEKSEDNFFDSEARTDLFAAYARVMTDQYEDDDADFFDEPRRKKKKRSKKKKKSRGETVQPSEQQSETFETPKAPFAEAEPEFSEPEEDFGFAAESEYPAAAPADGPEQPSQEQAAFEEPAPRTENTGNGQKKKSKSKKSKAESRIPPEQQPLTEPGTEKQEVSEPIPQKKKEKKHKPQKQEKPKQQRAEKQKKPEKPAKQKKQGGGKSALKAVLSVLLALCLLASAAAASVVLLLKVNTGKQAFSGYYFVTTDAGLPEAGLSSGDFVAVKSVPSVSDGEYVLCVNREKGTRYFGMKDGALADEEDNVLYVIDGRSVYRDNVLGVIDMSVKKLGTAVDFVLLNFRIILPVLVALSFALLLIITLALSDKKDDFEPSEKSAGQKKKKNNSEKKSAGKPSKKKKAEKRPLKQKKPLTDSIDDSDGEEESEEEDFFDPFSEI